MNRPRRPDARRRTGDDGLPPPNVHDDGTVGLAVGGRAEQPNGTGADASHRHTTGLAGRMFGAFVGPLVTPVVDQVDIDDVVNRIDIDHVLSRIHLDAVIERVDIDAVIERVDLDAVIERVDLDAVIERVDLDAVIERVDLDQVIDRV